MLSKNIVNTQYTIRNFGDHTKADEAQRTKLAAFEEDPPIYTSIVLPGGRNDNAQRIQDLQNIAEGDSIVVRRRVQTAGCELGTKNDQSSRSENMGAGSDW